ncbi:MAG: hypothetical protein GY795_03595 [Desulfobacterales bacterium]|nr:hypothetical protein [Desulfobacterales bacterium]
MKCLKAAICLFTVIQFFVTGTYAQAVQDDKNAVELSYFQENDTRGGDCVLKSSVLVKNGENLDRIISVYVQDDGKYFLSAWVKHINGQTLKVYLDDQVSPLGIMPTPKTGWQSSQLTGSGGNQKKISLAQGEHTFTFRCKGPVAPSAEYVRLALSKADSMISDTEYQNYISRLKSASLPDNCIRLKQGRDSNAATAAGNVIYPDTASGGDYLYKLDMSFTYTNYINIYLYEGQTKVFETKKEDPYISDPVMHLFSLSDPLSFSLTDEDSGEGPQAKITCTVPSDGWYILLLRAQGQYPGLTDVYMGDLKIDSDAPVAGSMVSCSQISKTGQKVNYFTSHLKGYMADTRIWLIGSNGLIAAYNNNYGNHGGDWIWGNASRIYDQFYRPIHYVLVSAFVPNAVPAGICDLYMKCGYSNSPSSINPGTGKLRFPKLKSDDAIKAAPASRDYNCIAWSGGIWWKKVWPPSEYSSWYDKEDALTSFDNYYMNQPKRYAGASCYTRVGADKNNSVIDLWALNGEYVHASVRKHKDNPHGYNWESKDGAGNERLFHPRYALEGDVYGSVAEYYIEVECPQAQQPREKSDLAEYEMVKFTEADNNILDALITDIAPEIRQEFRSKYTVWKDTWANLSFYSNPRKYAESEQYYDFLEFCKIHDETIPLLFRLFEQDEFFVINPIKDLTSDQYGYLKDEIRQESSRNRYDKNGVYLIPSLKCNVMKYLKKIIELSASEL